MLRGAIKYIYKDTGQGICKGRLIARIILCCTVVSCAILPSIAFCESAPEEKKKGPSGFFERNQARNIFRTTLTETEKKEIVLEREERKSLAERRKEREGAKESVKPKKNDSFALATKQSSPFVERAESEKNIAPVNFNPKTSKDPQQALRDRIVGEFGDPTKRMAVKAQDSAPRPFKGLLAALGEGDDELAYEYAKQYAQYQKDLISTINRAVNIEDIARGRENGVAPEDLAEKFPDLAHLLDSDAKKIREKELANKNYSRELSDKARDMIKEMEERSYDAFNNRRATDPIANQLNEQEERAKARQILSKRGVPQDRNGRVNIFFFLRFNNKDVLAMAGDIEKLYKQTLKYKGSVNFIALTIDNYNVDDAEYFKKKTGTTFPITSGFNLARTLGITVAPTVSFITQTTNKQYTEEGIRNFYFYDELLNIMRGR